MVRNNLKDASFFLHFSLYARHLVLINPLDSCLPLSHSTLSFICTKSPICARLTAMGTFVNVSATSEEAVAQDALFSLHPAMSLWPDDHSWFFFKLELTQLWLVNIYGGASTVLAADYFAANSTDTTMVAEKLGSPK